MSESLRLHESQYARPPCPSPTPGVHSHSRPSSQWCHPAISSSAVPFSSCPKSLPESESFPVSQLFAWGGQSIGVSALASVLPKKSQGWSPSEYNKSPSNSMTRIFPDQYLDNAETSHLITPWTLISLCKCTLVESRQKEPRAPWHPCTAWRNQSGHSPFSPETGFPRASLIPQSVKGLPAMQETGVQFLGQEDPLEKEMATCSSILPWRIP